MNKKSLFAIAILLFIIFLFVFSKSNIIAAKEGMLLWVNSVIPTLFPFFVATELLSYTNVSFYLGKFFNKIMRPIFNVPGEGAYPFIMGILLRLSYRCKNSCQTKRRRHFNFARK